MKNVRIELAFDGQKTILNDEIEDSEDITDKISSMFLSTDIIKIITKKETIQFRPSKLLYIKILDTEEGQEDCMRDGE